MTGILGMCPSLRPLYAREKQDKSIACPTRRRHEPKRHDFSRRKRFGSVVLAFQDVEQRRQGLPVRHDRVAGVVEPELGRLGTAHPQRTEAR